MEALRNVFDTNHDGKLDAGDAAFGQFKLMVTNADGTTTVETLAQAGITAIDLTQSSTTRSFADGSSVDGQSSFTRTDGSTGTVAAVTYAADAQGYAVRTTTTVNADGATTVDNRALNGDGSLNNDTSSTTSADGTTRTISYDTAGNGVVDRTQTIVDTVASGGARTETVSDYDGQDHLVDSTATTTAPDGSVFIRRDTTGGGITTQTETRKVLPSSDTGDTLADVSADGTVIDSTFTQIGQNGLGRDVQVDHAGTGHYDHSTVSRTTVAADGTRTETIIGIDHDQSATNSDTIVTSPDAQTRTDSISFDGDTVEQVQVAQTSYDATGDVTTRTTTTDGDQSEVLGITATTVSGDGLSKTTRRRTRASGRSHLHLPRRGDNGLNDVRGRFVSRHPARPGRTRPSQVRQSMGG